MAGQRCPRCRRTFRVLDDEVGMHDCPSCGYTPYEEAESDDETPDDETPEPDEG